MSIKERKDDHIEICLDRNVSSDHNYWDDIFLVHRAVPRVDLEDIDLTLDLLGRRIQAPLIISAMTGGTRKAMEFNRLLARGAEEYGLGMGVGSQRGGLKDGGYIPSYEVVKEFEIPLVLGNIGAPQLSTTMGENRYGPEEIKQARDMIDAHAICIHLNYLQEVVQPEGETHVSGVLERIERIAKEVPLIAKETGAGISREDALALKGCGIKGFDVGGLSGTTFAGVESFRGGPREARIGKTFWNWGIPTPVSVRVVDVGLPIIATGGLRNGIDVVRALSLGASSGGMALHLLKAASRGYEALSSELEIILDEIRASLFLSGALSATDRGSMKGIMMGKTREIFEGLYG